MGSALSFDNQRWNVLITKYLRVFYMMCTCTCTGKSMGKGVQLMVWSICWTAVLRYCDHIRERGGWNRGEERQTGRRARAQHIRYGGICDTWPPKWLSTPIGATSGDPNICTEQALPPPPDLRIVWLPWEHNQWAINSLGIRATCTVYQQPSNMGERRGEEEGGG